MALIKLNNRSSEDTAIHGRRNLIINGACLVKQYPTDPLSGVTTGRVVDRFHCASNASDWEMSRSTDVPSSEDFIYSIKISPTSTKTPSAGTYAVLGQSIEGQNMAHFKWGTSNAQPIVITFWVKSSKTGIYTYCIKNSVANRSYITEYTINAANTWEKKTIYVTGDTTGSWPADNSRGMTNDFWLAGENTNSSTLDSWRPNNQNMSTNQVNFFDNTSNEFYFTGLQVEVGTVATPFEHRSYADELLACQRYYAELPCFSGPGTGTTDTRGYGSHVVQMRTAPTLGVTGVMNITDGYSYDRTQSSASITLITNTVDFSFFNLPNFSSITGGRIHFGPRNQNANKVTLDSEL